MTTTALNRRPGRWISILLVVLGSIGLVFAVGGGVVRGVAAHSATSQSWSAPVDGVEALSVDTAAAGFEVRFDDIDEARLDASTDGGPVQSWRLERDGATLRVDAEHRWGWFGFGGWFGGRNGEEHVVLTLPAALERAGLDLDVDVAAGSFDADADWGTALVQLSAGSVALAGDAESLGLEVSAGEARLDLATAGDVTMQVSAGRVIGALTGEQPASITADVSAGSIELSIPDGAYAVTQDVSAGDATIDVDDDRDAASTIDVQVSAGSISLRGETR
ncbi:hypothetical protein [Agrococcus sp. DT81.2]|uniref:hypothetical protein n=1 Tax=Agrococcus sp. DT81.2 TaxID=3393414 RepID=UPI003CE52102